MTIQAALSILEALAPPRLAASWDNVGLMVGNPDAALTGIAVCVDPTFEAVAEARALGANLVVAHHPLLFKPARALDTRIEPGRTVEALLQHGMVLYAAHTNLDATAVNQALAEKLGLVGHSVLDPTGRAQVYTVAVAVPEAEAEALCRAAWAAGAGRTEKYEQAAYAHAVEGTFTPTGAAAPAVGEPGRRAWTHERWIRFRVGQADLQGVLAAVRRAHPYEEPALEVVAHAEGGEVEGFGLVGDLAEPETLEAFARRVKAALGLPALKRIGPAEQLVRRVAWLGGSGGDYFRQAKRAGADVYVTGEVRHHAALDGLALGLSFLEAGHVGSEQPVVPHLAGLLRERLPGVPVHELLQHDPFAIV